MIIKCLICGKILKPYFNWEFDSDKPCTALFNNADTWEISCNYGSRFDMLKFVFGLCDDCIQKKIDEKLLIPNGDVEIF